MLGVPLLRSCPVLLSCVVRLKPNKTVFHLSNECWHPGLMTRDMEKLDRWRTCYCYSGMLPTCWMLGIDAGCYWNSCGVFQRWSH